MKRAVCDLAKVPDDILFKEVAKGIPDIVQNAVSLNETARRLYETKEYRASEIIRGFAEEEAAKVLILVDAVRCPPTVEQKSKTLNYFYSHLAKRIYAMTCGYPMIASFQEYRTLVELECRSYVLDGPNQVDWIFANSTTAEREEAMYVDYVQDLTEDDGQRYWRKPIDGESLSSQYETAHCIEVCKALSEVGAKSADGLALIAEIWRGFEPEPETDRRELQTLIEETLARFTKREIGDVDESSAGQIISGWSFPLWPLKIRASNSDGRTLSELREERTLIIEWHEVTEAKRDPRPAIARTKVEALSAAYAAWKHDKESSRCYDDKEKGGGVQFVSSPEMEQWFNQASYVHVRDQFRELSEDERVALLALGWFAKERIADWPKAYENARSGVASLGEVYQIGLGSYWLAGLNRWEAEPRQFEPGEWYR